MRYDNIDSFDKKVVYSYDTRDEEVILDLFKIRNANAPKTYIQFIKHYGAICILTDVMVKGATAIPRITINENYVPIGRFLSWSKSDMSILRTLEIYKDQFPVNFIPFMNGCSGDYVGFSIERNGSYTINYWFHEELHSLITHKVSDDFDSFVKSIIRHSIPADEENIKGITHIPSPKMIELLKKTGKWKGD